MKVEIGDLLISYISQFTPLCVGDNLYRTQDLRLGQPTGTIQLTPEYIARFYQIDPETLIRKTI